MHNNFLRIAFALVCFTLLCSVGFSQGVTMTITPEQGNPQGAPNQRWLFTIVFVNGSATSQVNGQTVQGPYFVDHFQAFTSNVGAIDPTNDSCMFQYTNRDAVPRFSIFADTPYITLYSGAWSNWSAGISENSQCRVWAQDATRTTPQDGPDLTLRFYVEGTSLMEGDYGVRISYGSWYSNYSSGWGNFTSSAIWTPRSTLPNLPSDTVLVNSQSSQGASFDLNMSSTGGAGNGVRALTRALFIVNSTSQVDGLNACYAIYHRTSHEIAVIDASGNSTVGARLLGTSPSSSALTSSSNCSFDLGQAWYSETFSSERIILPVTFSNSFINRAGVKNVFFLPIDRPGNTSNSGVYPDQTWPGSQLYSISGLVGVGTTGVSGVTVNLTGPQTRTATTDSNGNYSFSALFNGSYSISPSQSGYTFLPPGQTFSNLASNMTGNFSIGTIEVPILPGGTPPGPVDPTPVPTPPADVTASATFCNDISGYWNSANGYNYSLFQTGSTVTGTATLSTQDCGNLRWDVSGQSTGDGLFTVMTTPNPFVSTRCTSSGSFDIQILSCSTATISNATTPPVGQNGIRSAAAPTTTWTRTSTPPGIQVTANVYSNSVEVSLTGQNKQGNLSVAIRDSQGQSSLNLGQQNQVSSGYYIYGLKRLELTPGRQYGTVTATWDTSNLQLPIAFQVIGGTRYTSYNTPNESYCSGPGQPAFIVEFQGIRQSCLAQTTTLNSNFIQQVQTNGSGISPSLGTLVPLTRTWMNGFCRIPLGLGATDANTFVRNVQIAGSCLTAVAGDISLAVSPIPSRSPGTGQWNCGDHVLLVDPNTTQNNSIRVVQDTCPACGLASTFGGQRAHIDAYSSSPECSLNDTGNFFSIRLR